eukprot:CAMPEP_0116935512 /NCGR_PEP_ID=MMETSP0467-20121206/30320_1 /TAXON_ID=283647 /ORGANISM="Mesodinium pulex, Strain SPMC105" /LENGTH=155 /DNA_ID=CAMNT_0004616885 /DNA_START=553 /DNA_END=1020 /DNA_ORIENTATION=+
MVQSIFLLCVAGVFCFMPANLDIDFAKQLRKNSHLIDVQGQENAETQSVQDFIEDGGDMLEGVNRFRSTIYKYNDSGDIVNLHSRTGSLFDPNYEILEHTNVENTNSKSKLKENDESKQNIADLVDKQFNHNHNKSNLDKKSVVNIKKLTVAEKL